MLSERFRMTSPQPCWCSKQMKRRPCGVVREMNSFFLSEHFFGLIYLAAGDVSKILQVKKECLYFHPLQPSFC